MLKKSQEVEQKLLIETEKKIYVILQQQDF